MDQNTIIYSTLMNCCCIGMLRKSDEISHRDSRYKINRVCLDMTPMDTSPSLVDDFVQRGVRNVDGWATIRATPQNTSPFFTEKRPLEKT